MLKFFNLFIFILRLYDKIFDGDDRLLDNDNIIFNFFSTFTSFLKKIGKSIFQRCSKTLQNYIKTKQYIEFMKL